MIRRAAAHAIAAYFLGWLLLGCRCPKPVPVVPPPPVVTVAPALACDRPVRPAKPPLWVEEIEDGRLAASQFHWADVVGYILKAEAYADASDACLATVQP